MKRIFKPILLCALVVGLIMVGSLNFTAAEKPLEAEQGASAKHVPGELLIKFKPGVDAAAMKNINKRHGANADVQEPTADVKMYVADITITLSKKGPNYTAEAMVIVFDESGAPLGTATVSNDWFYNGQFSRNVSSDTNGGGVARLKSPKAKANNGDVFQLDITNLTKAGYVYDSSLNVETSAFIIVN